MGLPDKRQREIVERCRFLRRTERTIVSPEEFLESLAASAQRGYAIDDGEDERQGRCVAASIWGNQGEVVAAIGLSGTLSQAPAHKIDSIGRLVRDAADRVSRRLGFETEPSAGSDSLSIERNQA
jgi:IclR family acetate operon transcriptional repressor